MFDLRAVEPAVSAAPDLPPAYNGCGCACHRRTNFTHVRQCCGPYIAVNDRKPGKGLTVLAAAMASLLLAPPVPAADTKVLSFSSTFHEPVTPTGGAGKWRSRFDWGRYQAGNGELAPYTDAATDPGVTPHPFVAGKRVLRAERRTTHDGGRTFAYSAPMMTTQGWRKFRYGFFQLTATVCGEKGVVPAWWMLPADGSWPPEIDIFEVGFDPAGTQMFGNIHLKDAAGVYTQANHTLSATGDCKQHVYGFNWTSAYMQTFVDGKMIDSRPNSVDVPMYVILDTAVGLASPGPLSTAPDWHNDFTLTSLRIWQEPGDITPGW